MLALFFVPFLVLSFWDRLQPPGHEDMPVIEADTVAARKDRFFDYLRPIVRHENRVIREQRLRLQRLRDTLAAGGALAWLDRRWLADMARAYRLAGGGEDDETPLDADLVAALLERVDVIPESLALVQSAKESSWGRSRFAREGNNLFGQWCHEPGCGLTPTARKAGRSHEVERFGSVRASVRSYFRNLNTHAQYRELRRLRAALRKRDEPLTGVALADGLTFYSERRQAYVDEVKAMIRNNGLDAAAAAGGGP